jgi:RND family efflux transporter MFP subunit
LIIFVFCDMKLNKTGWLVGVLVVSLSGVAFWQHAPVAKPLAPPALGKAALTVHTATLKPAEWMQNLTANGSVVAWQEAIIGSEVSGVRITDVRVNVGDLVRRGQVLARLAVDTMQVNEAETQATLHELEAVLAEVSANVARTRRLAESGFVSAQQLEQALTNEKTAKARLEAQSARHKSSALRLSQQNITAPDDGVISSRSATVGALTQPGSELFRLIRQGRLEWLADLTADELGVMHKGMKVELMTVQGRPVHGVVSAIAPSINPQTRYGRVLVELPANSGLIAGMFLRGSFQLTDQTRPVSVLPQSAVMLRDGRAFVFVVGADLRVKECRVTVGRRYGDQIEVIDGLASGAQVVETGGAFLVEGDTVRVAAREGSLK